MPVPILPEQELSIKENHVYEITLSKNDYQSLSLLLSTVPRLQDRTHDDNRGTINLCFLYSEYPLYDSLFHQIRCKNYSVRRDTVS